MGLAVAPRTVLTTDTTDVAHDIMARLKAGTASLHARLDATVEPMLADRGRYRELIASLRDAYDVIERELARHAGLLAQAGYDAAERVKLPWLADDIIALRGVPSARTIPQTYSLLDPSAAFGAVYVVEGATLGGQVIARQVIPSLALSSRRGCRFFSGYGGDTGRRWRETRDAITRYVESTPSDTANRIIAGARATFSLIEAALPARGDA